MDFRGWDCEYTGRFYRTVKNHRPRHRCGCHCELHQSFLFLNCFILCYKVCCAFYLNDRGMLGILWWEYLVESFKWWLSDDIIRMLHTMCCFYVCVCMFLMLVISCTFLSVALSVLRSLIFLFITVTLYYCCIALLECHRNDQGRLLGPVGNELKHATLSYTDKQHFLDFDYMKRRLVHFCKRGKWRHSICSDRVLLTWFAFIKARAFEIFKILSCN